MFLNANKQIVFVSGRDEVGREPTLRFINKHFGTVPGPLLMRKKGDMRKDAIVKKEIYDAHIEPFYFVEYSIDDREQVCQLWRSLGLTCLQVAEGKF